MAPRVRLTYEVHEGVIAGIFHDDVLRRGLRRFASDSWPTSAKLEREQALWASADRGGHEAVFELDDGVLAHVHVGFGTAHARVAAASDEQAQAALEQLRAKLPRSERDEDRVRVTFWSYGLHGPMPMSRELVVPTWTDIERNYPEETKQKLAALMDGAERPWRGGQLILWHGETGTGKTTALRALAREWSPWCEAHYITDPEKFFGDKADYMLSVMLESEAFPEDEEDEAEFFGEASMMASASFATSFVVGGRARPSNSWRLLVLEDTGELLAADARAQAGQGLSRFLNVVDGLIGQGLRLLVLVTTNEELGALHPAVARPGRCAAQVAFDRLQAGEANAWLSDHGQEPTAREPMTLASLYAAVEGWEAVEAKQTIGFGRVAGASDG